MGEPNSGSSSSSRRGLRVLLRLVCASMLAVFALTTIWNAAAVPIESRLGAAVAFVALLHASFWTHAAAVLAAGGLLAVVAGARWIGTGSMVAAAAALAPWAWSHVRLLPDARASDIAVLSANLCYSRADLSLLAAEAAHRRADVLILQEVNEAIVPALLEHFGTTYPHHVIEPRPDAFGEAVFSTRPLERSEDAGSGGSGATGLGNWALPCIDVTVQFEQGPVRIVNVHTVPPISISYVREQDRMARQLAEMARDARTPLIMAGDFNSPEMGVPVRRVTAQGMRSAHAARGRGLGATWPRTGAAASVLATRIDQILFSSGLTCTETGQGADTGSDHRPVWARFEIEGPVR